ncbi:MAG: DUF1569 domain-containing protein [Ignavibacteriaceae bacterium]|jgi:hypothetical protein
MKNIIDEPVKKSLINRVLNVSIEDKAQWGKMNVHEMICHCSDQLKMSMGLRETEYVGKPVLGSIVKRLVLMGMPIPKGKVKTVKELEQGVGGTKPIEFEKDREVCIKLINDFAASFQNTQCRIHPVFGKLNSNQWGKLAYTHLNHHLSQFNR